EDTLNIDINEIEKHITKKTKAIIPVHYGGQPCDMDEINNIAKKNNLFVIEDAAHALPAFYKNKKVGTLSDVTCFSFYVTKCLSTGEGGMICTDNEEIANRTSIMRLHGISKDAWNRYSENGSWYYEVIAPGYKYNFTDIQAALGLAQLKKINEMLDLRKRIYQKYNAAFSKNDFVKIFKIKNDRKSSHHLYPIQIEEEKLKINRSQFIDELKKKEIGTSVHFIPLYRHPFYKKTFNLDAKNFPISEKVYPKLVSLPIWPGMKESQIQKVIDSVFSILNKNKK
ncbi:MAG: DegT/DnrJ/EryC1/StrS family aminotransferase, partial [Ignavibacteriaceae bacterium]